MKRARATTTTTERANRIQLLSNHMSTEQAERLLERQEYTERDRLGKKNKKRSTTKRKRSATKRSATKKHNVRDNMKKIWLDIEKL